MKMNAGRVASCSLVSHVECAPRGLLRRGKKTDRQTNGRTDRYITLTANDAARLIRNKYKCDIFSETNNIFLQANDAQKSSATETLPRTPLGSSLHQSAYSCPSAGFNSTPTVHCTHCSVLLSVRLSVCLSRLLTAAPALLVIGVTAASENDCPK